LILGGVVTIVVFVLRLIDSTHDVGLGLGYVFRLFPAFSFGYGLINISNRDLYRFKFYPLEEKHAALSWDIAGQDCLYLGITSVVYFLAVFFVEYLLLVPSIT